MHSRLFIKCALIATLAASIWSNEADAQTSFASDPVAVLNAVMRYRMFWLGDSTKFDTCAAFEAVGKPPDFPKGIDKLFLSMLDADVSQCGRPASERVRIRGARVVVDVVAAMPAIGELRLSVRRGEYGHTEKYSLVRNPLVPKGFDVERVTIWGFSVSTGPAD